MRKISIVTILFCLLLFNSWLYAGDGKCIKCHLDYRDGYMLKDDFRGDIYRILEHPCSPLSKIREECFNTEMLILKTQNIIDELGEKERIKVGQWQKNLDVWIGKYRELLSKRIYSLQEFKDESALIRFNIQKIYSVLLVIFFIQGFRNAAGHGHPASGGSKERTAEKIAGGLIILLLLVQPLSSQTGVEAEGLKQNKTYLDRLSEEIEPMKSVSEDVYYLARLSQIIKSEEPDYAFKLLIEGRKLWNVSLEKLNNEVLPLYQNPDKSGWGESDENRYEKIKAILSGICAPYALRELVLAEIDFNLDKVDKRFEEMLGRYDSISKPYEKYGQLSETAGLLAGRNVELAIAVAEKIHDPFFKARAYARIAKFVKPVESKLFSEKAICIA